MVFYAGIDWSETLNDVAVVDGTGTVVARARVPESPAGVTEILRLLAGLRRGHQHSRTQVPIAIETRHGLLVAALRAAGQPVVALNPTVVARYRGRLTPTKQKSDKGDAALLAHILRTDGHHHRALPAESDQAAAVRILARAQLAAMRSRHHQLLQLRALLRSCHPAMLHAWSGLRDGLLRGEARAVLALAPTPAQAARLTRHQLRAALAAGGRTRLLDDHATRLHTLFRQKTLRQPPKTEDALGIQIHAYLALLNQMCDTVEHLTREAAAAFARHPHARIYHSFPGVGPLTGARLLGEIGDDTDRFTSARGLRAYAGAAPLTWSSGKSTVVTHRWIANKYLKHTGHTWAFTTLTHSPGCRAHYDRRRATGDPHPAALRNLFGKLLTSLHHCIRRDLLYNEHLAWPHPAPPHHTG